MALLYYEKEKKKQVLFYFLFHFVFISFSERIIRPLFFLYERAAPALEAEAAYLYCCQNFMPILILSSKVYYTTDM